MAATAIEDKKLVGMHEAKARDLQVKINALLNIEKACSFFLCLSHCLKFSQDIRGCIEQLQTIEKEVGSLQMSQKELAECKDHMDDKKIERNELKLRQEVRNPVQYYFCTLNCLPKRVEKQLSNAHDKLERAQRHAEDKKTAGQRTIERLQREYDEMAVERRDNDKQVEELRLEADGVETKVCSYFVQSSTTYTQII